MLFKEVPINGITVYNKETKEIIARVTEDGIDTKTGYDVLFDVITFEKQNDWLTDIKAILYFKNNPAETYIVTDANNKFFTMTRIVLDEKQNLTLDSTHQLIYPNNSLFGTLEDLGLLVLETGDNNG